MTALYPTAIVRPGRELVFIAEREAADHTAE